MSHGNNWNVPRWALALIVTAIAAVTTVFALAADPAVPAAKPKTPQAKPAAKPAAPTKTAPATKTEAAPAKPAKPAAAKPADPASAKKPVAAKAAVEETAEKPAAEASAGEEAAIKEIEGRAEQFALAYNEHNAEKLAALFDKNAQFIADEGDLLVGRDAIEKRYTERFEESPESWLVVTIDSIQVLTPTIAIEEGTAVSAETADETPVTTRYLVIHLKKDGEWYIGSVRDFPADESALTPHDHLLELAWMVGDWVDEHPQWLIRTTCKWSEDENFLLQDYRVVIEGQVAVTGSTRIGWDPLTKQIKSWAFTSDGGYSESFWARSSDDTWLSKSTGVTAEGQISAATHVFRYVDKDTFAWRSYDRSVAGEATPDVEEVLIKRRPPALEDKAGEGEASEASAPDENAPEEDAPREDAPEDAEPASSDKDSE